jgi:alpha-amylase/alpha-mannosidase (GH57 family)
VNICFLLHFYQPSNQLESVTKKIAQECYLPLVKLLKNDKRIKLTANFSLALLEQLDAYGFKDLIRDVKDLVDGQRLELVGSAAYHPLLTKIPREFAEKQIILNELAQGYYFGADKDFEGEACYMIKDLKGFFPPEMAINNSVLELLGSLDYAWVAVDEFCLPKDVRSSHVAGTTYRVGGKSPRLIIRDRPLSNEIAFKRDLEIASITAKLSQGDDDKLLAFDGETLGHHYRDGVYLFEAILSDVFKKGLEMATISQTFEKADSKIISHIEESTWSSTEVSAYPLWENATNKVNSVLWQLFNNIHDELGRKLGSGGAGSAGNAGSDIVAKPVWKEPSAQKESGDVRDTLLTVLRLEQSDQFWWSSGVELAGRVNFSVTMVASVLKYYREVIKSHDLDLGLLTQVAEIEGMLEGYKEQGQLT